MLLMRDTNGRNFPAAIGMYENHRVATGMDTSAWVARNRSNLDREIIELEGAVDFTGTSWATYFRNLRHFLTNAGSEDILIRHHYAWWYPKALDLFLAAWH
jgi:hypothetical protein